MMTVVVVMLGVGFRPGRYVRTYIQQRQAACKAD